jgi:hypothetical protein
MMIPLLAFLGALGLPATTPSDPVVEASVPCVAPAGPEYYAVELYTTKRVPGTGLARGVADVSRSHQSPFAVALTADGSYSYDLALSFERMKPPSVGTLVAWVATSDLDRVTRIGALDAQLRAAGSVTWNQFLVVVTLEANDDPSATAWSGPVAFRGMSRSGMLHTMIGHGALQQENCAAYGYRN